MLISDSAHHAEMSPSGSGDSLSPREADELFLEANVFFDAGQNGRAIERYSRALEYDKTIVAAWYNRGNARARIGDLHAALTDYNSALALSRENADILNNRGVLFLNWDRWDLALADFDEALRLTPDDAVIRGNRGLALLKGGQNAAALREFDRAGRAERREPIRDTGPRAMAEEAVAAPRHLEAELRELLAMLAQLRMDVQRARGLPVRPPIPLPAVAAEEPSRLGRARPVARLVPLQPPERENGRGQRVARLH